METIRALSEGLSQQQQHFDLDNLVNPVIMDVDNFGDPVGINVGHPENQPITLSQFAARKMLYAIAKSVEKIMKDHNFTLPAFLGRKILCSFIKQTIPSINECACYKHSNKPTYHSDVI